MPPKKKNNKTSDDWESELGETADAAPAAEMSQEKEPAEPTAEEGEEEGEEDLPATGLMALMRKRQKKNKAKGIEDGDQTEPQLDLSAKAPVEASIDDEFSLPTKKGKGKAGVVKAEADDDDEETGADGKIMTKAQKEKARKEREKQRKKENAAKKKSTGPAAKAEAAPAPEVRAAELAVPESSAGGKPKKLSPALLKIQKQQELLRKQQEEQARIEAEEKARIEEEEHREAEEEKRKEEAKAEKKRKEQEKIRQQKAAGTFLTKAQREEKLRNEMKLKQMQEAGLKIGGNSGGDNKKADYSKKGKGGKKNPAQIKADEEKALAEAAKRAQELVQQKEADRIAVEAEAKANAEKEAAELKAKQEDSDLEDDWEAAAAEESDEAKEDWDAGSQEERKKAATKTATAKKNSSGLPSRIKKAQESDSESDSESEDDEETSARRAAEAQRKREAAARREKAHEMALAAQSKDNLRSPICCILGHVDTGKTKLLDKIRQSNVQDGEAGGITQQIGATYFDVDTLKKKTVIVNKNNAFEFNVPGLLVIDTPGHESFSNLRSRGSSLCNIAILVVDIMHGLEPQTLESMKLLRDRKTPFIVALNKIDRLYGWEKIDNNGFRDSLSRQKSSVQAEFATRLEQTKLAFAEQSFNAELFYENKSMAKIVSLVPTSAHTGEGIPDMLKLIVQLTQERMVGSLMYLSEVQCTVLEVKAIEGFGMTIDVILSNGILREGDRIVLVGTNGAIATNIRALLTPEPLKELRVKSAYVHNKEVKAALGVKISAPGLETAIAGSRLMVVGPDDDESDLEAEVEEDLGALFSRVERSGRGVTVQASTMGSLEALLDFLKSSKIPVANIGIGPVFKRDVMNCGTMLEKNKEYAVMLCFDVKIDKEAQAYADAEGVLIFTADIIYHLFDAYTAHMDKIKAQKKEESKLLAVFPCVLKPVAVFNKTGPIIVGVDVVEGNLRMGTPICAVKTSSVTGVKEIVNVGRVTGIERDHKQLQSCKRGEPSVAVKIEMGSHQPTYGRHLEDKDTLYSMVSRKSIDCLKDFYRDEMTTPDWNLIKKLKPLFDIP